ncbi:MAG: hypothetical protein QM730_25130 [Anaerolineales bacterium]
MNTYNSVKRINDKVRRTFKYMRVRYQQANDRERLYLYLFVFMVLTYTWWLVVVI